MGITDPPLGSVLLAEVSDPDTLYAAWTLTRQRLAGDDPTGAAWSKEARRIEGDLRSHLGELAEQLRSGVWRPRPATEVSIPKESGGLRRLRVAPVADRLVERAVGLVLSPIVEPSLGPWSYAYRRGRGVADALRDLAWLREEGFRWVVRSDFAECFDEVDHDALLERLRQEVDDEWLLWMVGLLLNRPVQGRADAQPTREGVAQGGPLSPLLANLYLDAFDEQMVLSGTPLVRYADDIVLLAPSRGHAEQSAARASEVATSMGMRLNEEKTSVTSFDEGFAFLGEDVGPVHPVHELAQVESGELLRKALYVTLQGAHVRLAKGQIVVSDGKAELLRAPKSLVGHVVLAGSVGLSAGARSMALYDKVPVTFLSRRGSYLGRLDAAELARASLRRRQYRSGDDPARRLALAKRFVAGKLANQRTLVQRYTRRHSIPTLVGAAAALRQSRREALRAGSLNALRGVEGAASKVYFSAMASLLPDTAGFSGRRRRPPRDPVNAALGYAYAMLLGEVVSAISTVGLDPVAGYLHDDREKRPSLGLDLIEEFRPLIVDVVVIDSFRRRRLRPEHHFRSEGSGVFLSASGRAALIGAYEERMLTLFHHVPSGKRVPYRRALSLQAGQLVACLEDRKRTYEPVPWR